jgi:DNA-binding beta-propeller fold protein YncE
VAPAPKIEEQVAVSEPPPVTPDDTADGSYRTLEIEPKAFTVGKWPEGLVVAGGFVWVAESGDRSVAKLDPNSGTVLDRVKVGRLPVHMTADPDNTVYAAVLTEGHIFKQPPSQKGKSIAKFERPIYIQGLSYGSGAVYAASYAEVENRQTVISRIDPNTGKRTDSQPAGAEPRAFVMAQDSPWLLDASGMVTMYDTETLQPKDSIANDGFLWSMGANLDAVFVGGRTEQQNGKSIIYRYAQGNPQDRTMQVLDSEELIVAIAANNDRVAALGDGGSYWILDAISLKPLKLIKTGRRPQAAVFDNARLFVTTHAWEADHGAVLVYDNVGAIE